MPQKDPFLLSRQGQIQFPRIAITFPIIPETPNIVKLRQLRVVYHFEFKPIQLNNATISMPKPINSTIPTTIARIPSKGVGIFGNIAGKTTSASNTPKTITDTIIR